MLHWIKQNQKTSVKISENLRLRSVFVPLSAVWGNVFVAHGDDFETCCTYMPTFCSPRWVLNSIALDGP